MCCIETVCSPTAAKTFFFCIYNLFKVFIYLTSWIFHLKKVTLSCPLLAVLLFTQCTQGRSSWVASTSVQVISALWRRTSPFLVQEGGEGALRVSELPSSRDRPRWGFLSPVWRRVCVIGTWMWRFKEGNVFILIVKMSSLVELNLPESNSLNVMVVNKSLCVMFVTCGLC